MQFKDKLGNCLIQTVTYLSLNWSSQLSVICEEQHVPLEGGDTCESLSGFRILLDATWAT